MVRAILDGRKNQTRRVIKPQPGEGDQVGFSFFSGMDAIEMRNYRMGYSEIVKCPYGQPGDRLWVRETWQYVTKAEHEFWTHHRPDGCAVQMLYRATDTDWENVCSWVPSIHMFRWMSRITLEVVMVRVERVQGIGGTDAWQEGGFTVTQFIDLWDSINAKRGYGWDVNPWVWVVEFKKI